MGAGSGPPLPDREASPPPLSPPRKGHGRYHRDGLQSLQWYHDSNRVPAYGYTGIKGLQIVHRGLQVGIQVCRSTESLLKVYG